MIWGAFRPSDDAVEYRFNIPQNAIAVVALRNIVQLAVDGYRDRALARRAQVLGARVQNGIQLYGRFFNRQRRVWMYAYETDGFGRYNLMDDANIPKPYDAAVYRLVFGLRFYLSGHACVCAQHG